MKLNEIERKPPVETTLRRAADPSIALQKDSGASNGYEGF
jgi:hypothetical protein